MKNFIFNSLNIFYLFYIFVSMPPLLVVGDMKFYLMSVRVYVPLWFLFNIFRSP